MPQAALASAERPNQNAALLRTESPARPPESLSGLIERVTFFNEENGFGVLKVKAKGHRDLVTVVGSLPSASAGEWVLHLDWIRPAAKVVLASFRGGAKRPHELQARLNSLNRIKCAPDAIQLLGDAGGELNQTTTLNEASGGHGEGFRGLHNEGQ